MSVSLPVSIGRLPHPLARPTCACIYLSIVSPFHSLARPTCALIYLSVVFPISLGLPVPVSTCL